MSAESEEGLCYIETMQLDGETNLKIKKAIDETKHLTADSLRSFTVRAGYVRPRVAGACQQAAHGNDPTS